MLTSTGSVRFGGVRFQAYANDHPPRHVHGFYAEVEVIVDVLEDGSVDLAKRSEAFKPSNASASDIRHILNVAAAHHSELVALWEKHRD